MNAGNEQAKGRIKQAVGDLTGNKDLRREGKLDESAGKAKGLIDKLKRMLMPRR